MGGGVVGGSGGGGVGGGGRTVEPHRPFGIFDDCLSDVCVKGMMPRDSEATGGLSTTTVIITAATTVTAIITTTSTSAIFTTVTMRVWTWQGTVTSHGSDHAPQAHRSTHHRTRLPQG